MSEAWYEAVEASTRLTQGDLILDCPIITWKSERPQLEAEEIEILKASTEAIQSDVVVMTQACDLENKKVTNVILCPHISLSAYKEQWKVAMETSEQKPTEKAWQKVCDTIRDGYKWNLTMLNAGNAGGLSTEHRVVDFHDVYTIPSDFLESLLQQRQQPRLRLLPPYREHLSQAFARFFMRVGLPASVSKVW